ncbi:hypothetical protein D3C86_1467490 [compost metagenome]
MQQRPGNRDALFLPAGKLLAALAQRAVEPFGQRLDEAVQPCQARHFYNRLAAGIGHAVGQVVGQAAAKQHDVLADHGNAPAQRVEVKFAQVAAIQQNPPLLRVVEALQQVYQRRFARPRSAAQGDLAAIGHARLHPAQDGRAVGVAEVHVVETQLTGAGHGHGLRRAADAGLLATQFHDPAEADRHALQRHVQAQ